MKEAEVLKAYFNTNDVLFSPDRGFIVDGVGDYEVVTCKGFRYDEYLEMECRPDKEELIYLINDIEPRLNNYIDWDEYYSKNYSLLDFGWKQFIYKDKLYYIKKF